MGATPTFAPPAGYTLDTPASPQSITPPAGYTLDTPTGDNALIASARAKAAAGQAKSWTPEELAAMKQQSRPEEPSSYQGEPGIKGTAVGFGKEAAGTLFGAAAGVNRALNVVLPESAQLPVPAPTEKPIGTAEKIGGFGENVAEWMAGEKALKGITALGMMPEELLALAEKYPKTAKIVMGSILGGTQAGIKAAPEGGSEAVKAATGGAIGGAAGSAAGELAGEVVKPIAKTFGMGETAGETAARAVRPPKWDTNFLENWEKAAPRLKEIISGDDKFKNMWDAAGRIREAANDMWVNEITPIIEKHNSEVVNTDPVYDAIKNKITPSMNRLSPGDAKTLENIADQFNPSKLLTVEQLEGDLEFLNSKLRASGFYSKPSEEQMALLKTNPEIAAWDTGAKAIRDTLYTHLENAGENITDLKDTYGAISNIAKSVKGQANVAGRQVPVSLKTALGLAAGIAHGGWVGTLEGVALPVLDKLYNNPTAILNRAIGKGAQAGPVGEAVAAGGRALQTGAGVAGEKAGAEWVRMKSQDGSEFEVHPEDVSAAEQKGLTKVE